MAQKLSQVEYSYYSISGPTLGVVEFNKRLCVVHSVVSIGTFLSILGCFLHSGHKSWTEYLTNTTYNMKIKGIGAKLPFEDYILR